MTYTKNYRYQIKHVDDNIITLFIQYIYSKIKYEEYNNLKKKQREKRLQAMKRAKVYKKQKEERNKYSIKYDTGEAEDESDYDTDEEFEEDHDLSQNTKVLFRLAEEFCRDEGDYEQVNELIKAFVERVRSLDVDSAEGGEDVDTIEEDRHDAVTVSTIHQAKGLEWEHVIIVRMNRGICPINFRYESDPLEKRDENVDEQDPAVLEEKKRILSREHYAEERRLFYVGLTRAKKTCTLSFIENDNSQGPSEGSNNYPSQYLSEIPVEMIESFRIVNGELVKDQRGNNTHRNISNIQVPLPRPPPKLLKQETKVEPNTKLEKTSNSKPHLPPRINNVPSLLSNTSSIKTENSTGANHSIRNNTKSPNLATRPPPKLPPRELQTKNVIFKPEHTKLVSNKSKLTIVKSPQKNQANVLPATPSPRQSLSQHECIIIDDDDVSDMEQENSNLKRKCDQFEDSMIRIDDMVTGLFSQDDVIFENEYTLSDCKVPKKKRQRLIDEDDK
jgi:hypothetical protein